MHDWAADLLQNGVTEEDIRRGLPTLGSILSHKFTSAPEPRLPDNSASSNPSDDNYPPCESGDNDNSIPASGGDTPPSDYDQFLDFLFSEEIFSDHSFL